MQLEISVELVTARIHYYNGAQKKNVGCEKMQIKRTEISTSSKPILKVDSVLI